MVLGVRELKKNFFINWIGSVGFWEVGEVVCCGAGDVVRECG